MRFSLRRILTLFPAYFLAVIVAIFLEGPVRVTQRCEGVYNDARGILYMILEAEEEYGSAIPEPVVNRWLAGELDVLAADEFRLADKLKEIRPIDPWGRPYRFANEEGYFLARMFNKIFNVDSDEIPVGVYSLGMDGISESRGNDPDDMVVSQDRVAGDKSHHGQCGRIPLRTDIRPGSKLR